MKMEAQNISTLKSLRISWTRDLKNRKLTEVYSNETDLFVNF